MLLNSGTLWAASAVLAGWIVTRTTSAMLGALAGFAVLICAVLGYYVYGVTLGDRVGLGISALSGSVRVWLIASFIAGPLLGLAGAWTRRRDAVGVVARLLVPVGAVVEMVFYDRLRPDTFRVDPSLAWTQATVVAVAVGGAAWVIFAPRRVAHAKALGAGLERR